MSETNERILSDRIRRGDNAAMRDFYDLYAGKLMALCQRYIANDDDAKDILQESLIKIMTNAGRFSWHGEGSLWAWAARVAVNTALMSLRSSAIDTTSCDNIADDVIDDDDVVTDIHGIPPDIVQSMIRRLPDGYRTVFNLYVFEDMSHKEIADCLGITASTSASQYHRAKHILLKMIDDYKRKGGRNI